MLKKCSTHSETLREVKSVLALRAGLCTSVCGTEESRLVQIQQLQFLRVLGESGGKQQLL